MSLQSRLPHIAAELRPKVSAAVKVAAERIAADARDRVPSGPPDIHLRDHIIVQRLDGTEYEVVAGDNQAFYGHMVEFGTSHSAPHPFLIPALEANRDDAVRLVAEAIGDL